MGTNYYFLPYLRLGLSACLSANPGNNERAELPITWTFDAYTTSGGVESKSVTKNIQLYGPGDIAGINDQIIVDHDPKNQISDFEPNYFPTIQFLDPDFPWRYNAGIADDHKLLPWISLIVLIAEDRGDIRREFKEPEFRAKAVSAEQQILPYIEDVNTSSLPDLNESWRWAHVQITGSENFNGVEDIPDLLKNAPERISSRLLCTRRLQPGILYNAFLVPNFKLSFRPAGLPTDEAYALTLAWDKQNNKNIRLPYYYRWEFRTGESGDFEHLVRLLEARELTSVGKREMDCSNPGMDLSGIMRVGTDPEKTATLDLEGAVQALDMIPTIWGRDRGSGYNQLEPFQEDLRQILNRNREFLEEKTITIPDVYYAFTINQGKIIVAQDTALVSLQTSVATKLHIRYGRGDLDQDVESTQWSTHHSILIENLQMQSTYFLRVEALSHSGDYAETPILEFETSGTPQVVPPIYGQWHAKRNYVDSTSPEKGWLDELNLDPRHRAAAGVGADVIRRHQEEFMAIAWEQVGEIDRANAMINQAQLGMEVTGNIFKRLEELPDDFFFAQTTQLQARVKVVGFNSSVANVVRNSRVPQAVFKGNMRRIRRPYGPIHKRQARAMGKMTPLMNRQIIQLFNGEASQKPDQLFKAGGNELIPKGTISFSGVSTKFDERFIDKRHPMASANGMTMAMSGVLSKLILNQVDEGKISGDKNVLFAKKLGNFFDNEIMVSDLSLHIESHLDIPVLRNRFKQKMNPRQTILERLRGKLRIYDKPIEEMQDRIMAAPKFPSPMYEKLKEISTEWLIPGIETIPQNTISLLRTNRRFIEAFFCGCNHEFATELLWREYPTDQRGTYFRQFWQPIESFDEFEKARKELEQRVSYKNLISDYERERMIISYLEETGYYEKQKDISPIHLWTNVKLGENDQKPNLPGDDNLVLLIRGDLLQKYPNAVIYAIKGVKIHVNFLDIVLPGLDEYLDQEKYKPYTANIKRPDPKYPIFSAAVEPDINLLGFDVTVRDVINNEWFFVIEERVSETRFGLDVPSGMIIESQDNFQKNLAWDHFLGAGDDAFGKYINDLHPAVSVNIQDSKDLWERFGAASIAKATLQKPARVVVSTNKMIPKKLRERFNNN